MQSSSGDDGGRANTAAMPAPIALFVYNRLAHTIRTVEALLRNVEATQAKLYIFSDAPKNEAASEAVAKVRAYIRSIVGFASITIIEREYNWGLADSIIDGVSQLCERHGSAIVLEDDLEVSPYFLRYMNDALAVYADDDAVMHISGSAYPVGEIALRGRETYFLRVPLCWGWATWARAWRHFDRDISIVDRFSETMIRAFDFDYSYGYWSQLELNRHQKIKTWFVFWYATLFLRKGLALFPREPLVKNIGHDGSGVHCGATSHYDVEPSPDPIAVRRIEVAEDRGAVRAHIAYFRSIRPSLAARIRRKMLRSLSLKNA